MCASTRTRPSSASPTCRARRRPPRSTCRPGRAACRWRCSGAARFPRIGDGPYVVTLAPYGFFWFLLSDQPEADSEPADPPRIHHAGLDRRLEFAAARPRARRASSTTCCRSSCPSGAGSPTRRTACPIAEARSRSSRSSATSTSAAPRHRRGRAPARRTTSRYLLPLMVNGRGSSRAEPLSPSAIAAVRRGPREGTLLDAATDPDFIALLLQGRARGRHDRARRAARWNAARPARSPPCPPPHGRQGRGAEPRAVQHHRASSTRPAW